MSGKFVGASSHYLQQPSPWVTTPPLTVSFWLRLETSSNTVPWSMGDSGSSAAWEVWTQLGTVLHFDYWNGGSEEGDSFVTIAQNEWTFVIARMIATNNRRLTAVRPNGNVNHGNSTDTVTPTSLERMALGATWGSSPGAYLTGGIAEFCFFAGDIQADGGLLDNALAHQLAYRGPWSLPHLVPLITDYVPLFDGRPERLYQRGTPRPWAGTFPLVGPHPSLYGNYQGPWSNTRKLLTV